MGFWENVKRFNERWNDLPRRGAVVLMVLLALLVFAALFSYVAPSVIAMVLAWVIHPVAKRLEKALPQDQAAGQTGVPYRCDRHVRHCFLHSLLDRRAGGGGDALADRRPARLGQSGQRVHSEMDGGGRFPDLRRGDVRLADV